MGVNLEFYIMQILLYEFQLVIDLLVITHKKPCKLIDLVKMYPQPLNR
jgi:hypothetical protein